MKVYKTLRVSVSTAYFSTHIDIFRDPLHWKIFYAFLLEYTKLQTFPGDLFSNR